MKPQTLENLLAQDEGVTLEFKERINLDSGEGKAKFLRSILALANSSQGPSYFIIGIEDTTRQPLGVKHLTEEQLQQVVSYYCKPPIHFSFQIVPYRDTPIGVLEIFQSYSKPHTLKAKLDYQDSSGKQKEMRDNQVFIRRGSTIGEASVDEIIAMAQESNTETEQRERIAYQVERVGSEMEDISYVLNETLYSRSRERADSLIENTFVSILAGGLIGWLSSLGWLFAPISAPLCVLIISVLASATKIIHYGAFKAVVMSLILGIAIGTLYQLGSGVSALNGLSSGDIVLRVAYGAMVGAIAGVIVSIGLSEVARAFHYTE